MYNKSIFFGFAIFVCFIAINSCNQKKRTPVEIKHEKLIKQWVGKKIITPPQLVDINENSGSHDLDFKFIHFFSGDCGGCYSSLKRWDHFARSIENEKNTEMLFISNFHDRSFIEDKLIEENFTFSIMVDTADYFNRSNNFNSTELYTFLLNKNDECILFGDPLDKQFQDRVIQIISE